MHAHFLETQEGLLAYTHDIIRQAVRESMPATALRSLDRQAAATLMDGGALPIEVALQIAHSAEIGDDQAVRTFRDASRTLASTDPSAAANLSLRALELSRRDDSLRSELAADTALYLHAAGRIAEGTSFVEDVLGA